MRKPKSCYEIRAHAIGLGYVERGRSGSGPPDWEAMKTFIKEHEADPWVQYMVSITVGDEGIFDPPVDGLPLDTEQADKTPSRVPKAVPLAEVGRKSERTTAGDLEARNAGILRLAGSLSQKELADRFGLSQGRVSQLVREGSKRTPGRVVQFPGSG